MSAIDPKRHFATVNCRVAKGLYSITLAATNFGRSFRKIENQDPIRTSAAVQVPVRLNPKKARWNPRGTEELALCASGWSLGIKGLGDIGLSASRRRSTALSAMRPAARGNLRIGWIIAAVERNSDPVEMSLRAKRSNPRRVLCKPIKMTTSVPIAP